MALSRRSLLGGAAALAVVAGGGGVALENSGARHWLRQRIDPVDEPNVPVPNATPGEIVRGTFMSTARQGRDVGWAVAYPPGHAPGAALPVTLVLYGRSGDENTPFEDHALQYFLAEVVGSGTPPFALACADGGPDTYWHRRADGDDPQRMLVDEFIPLLADRGLRTGRIGLKGWSMGGYGSLLLAETLGRSRVAAVAVDSPALWTDPADSAPGAFDDRADFVSHDVFAGRSKLRGIPVHVACGLSDPFYGATRTFVAGVPDLAATVFTPGGHEVAYWRSVAAGDLRFLGRRLGTT